jgi:hypothetical protein
MWRYVESLHSGLPVFATEGIVVYDPGVVKIEGFAALGLRRVECTLAS